MALKIWLPLNGNLNNYGIGSGYTIVQNGGEPIYGQGKFPKGLVCNGSKNWRISGITLTDRATITWWSKTTVSSKMPWVLECNVSSYLNFYEATIYTLNTGDSNNNPFKTDANANINILNDGTWHHFAVTFGDSKALLYIDGVYAGKATTFKSPACTNRIIKLAGDFNRAHNYDYNGMLNDFRVYDNTLSADDIKDIYWGKVLEIAPQWRDNTRVKDASGVIATKPLTQPSIESVQLTPKNLTTNGNQALFNGTSTEIDFVGLGQSGGTVSIWFSVPSKPTVQRVVYCDPSSKMIIGFLTTGNLLIAANSTSKNSWSTTGMTWGQLNNVVAVYGADKQPTACYINGVQPATAATSVWSNRGETTASVGRRISEGYGNDFLSGSVNEVKVYTQQLTAADAKEIYQKGPNPNNWGEDWRRNNFMVYSGCTWFRVLHHNAPASNLFTAANGKNNETQNLWSKLGQFYNGNTYKSIDGKYQFMVREKLESSSVENVGIWTQTSNPTASTIAGYTQIYTSTGSWPRSFGLTHQDTRAVFDDSGASTWWCSCGCNTAYSGGIPGFWGVVKTGYMDLYVRIDNVTNL